VIAGSSGSSAHIDAPALFEANEVWRNRQRPVIYTKICESMPNTVTLRSGGIAVAAPQGLEAGLPQPLIPRVLRALNGGLGGFLVRALAA
jgi:hypothetical protein